MPGKKAALLVTLLLFMLMSVPAFSWTLGVGASSYYSFWNPAWAQDYNNVKIDPALMAGPLVSLTIYEDFTLTGLYMRSINNPGADYTATPSGTGPIVTFNTRLKREEGEANLMYALSRAFRIFAGYKMQAFTEEAGRDDVTVPNPAISLVNAWNNEFRISGPGAGIAVVLPLTKSLGLSMSTSLIYLWIKYQGYKLEWGSSMNGIKDNNDYTGIGNNSALSLFYSLPSINTVISLGGRFQYLRYIAKGSAPSLGNDYYYGVTLAAVYYFE
jgi:hypothetical protein